MGVALVLLAAGDSRRFHGNKLLYKLDGKPMFRYLADELSQISEDILERRIVVTQYAEIMAELTCMGYLEVENHNSRLGISHSIHLALDALDSWEGSICFAVCDQPFLKKETIISLIQGYEASGKGLGCLSYQGQLGNPAVFSPLYRPKLFKLSGDTGGKQIIRQNMEDLYLHEVTNCLELEDIDIRTEEKKK